MSCLRFKGEGRKVEGAWEASWHTPLTPAFRLISESKICLVYIESSRTPRITQREPVSKQTNRKTYRLSVQP